MKIKVIEDPDLDCDLTLTCKVLTPEIEKKMLEHTPIQRLGEADDIAGAMLYFAAPLSEWVSGQTIFVNGGGVQTLD